MSKSRHGVLLLFLLIAVVDVSEEGTDKTVEVWGKGLETCVQWRFGSMNGSSLAIELNVNGTKSVRVDKMMMQCIAWQNKVHGIFEAVKCGYERIAGKDVHVGIRCMGFELGKYFCEHNSLDMWDMADVWTKGGIGRICGKRRNAVQVANLYVRMSMHVYGTVV